MEQSRERLLLGRVLGCTALWEEDGGVLGCRALLEGAGGCIGPGLSRDAFTDAGTFDQVHRELKQRMNLGPDSPGSKHDAQKCGG